MTNQISCSNCGLPFDPEQHLEEQVSGIRSLIELFAKHTSQPLRLSEVLKFEKLHLAPWVICPSCKNRFRWDGFRFFGLFSCKQMAIFLLGFLLLFLLVPVLVLLRDLS